MTGTSLRWFSSRECLCDCWNSSIMFFTEAPSLPSSNQNTRSMLYGSCRPTFKQSGIMAVLHVNTTPLLLHCHVHPHCVWPSCFHITQSGLEANRKRNSCVQTLCDTEWRWATHILMELELHPSYLLPASSYFWTEDYFPCSVTEKGRITFFKFHNVAYTINNLYWHKTFVGKNTISSTCISAADQCR